MGTINHFLEDARSGLRQSIYAPGPSPTGGTGSDPLGNSDYTGGGNDPAMPNADLSGVIPREVSDAQAGGGAPSEGSVRAAPIMLAQNDSKGILSDAGAGMGVATATSGQMLNGLVDKQQIADSMKKGATAPSNSGGPSQQVIRALTGNVNQQQQIAPQVIDPNARARPQAVQQPIKRAPVQAGQDFNAPVVSQEALRRFMGN